MRGELFLVRGEPFLDLNEGSSLHESGEILLREPLRIEVGGRPAFRGRLVRLFRVGDVADDDVTHTIVSFKKKNRPPRQ